MANAGLDLFADGFGFLEVPRWHEGRLWAADMFAGHVVAFAADGAAQMVITVPEVLAGFGWMPDGALLVVTRGGRLLRQQAGPAVEVPSPLSGGPVPCNEMTVDGLGRAATTLPEVIAQVSVGPDGIALDAAGAVWVANPFGREVLRVLEGGEITDRLSTGELGCYACALGGPDGHTLFHAQRRLCWARRPTARSAAPACSPATSVCLQ
jgi:sugar lactone lactonase YvrE